MGCVAVARGDQGATTTLATLRTVAHALRGWPTPLGIALSGESARFADPPHTATIPAAAPTPAPARAPIPDPLPAGAPIPDPVPVPGHERARAQTCVMLGQVIFLARIVARKRAAELQRA
ncbi:hypothetical protein HNP84_004123 [Thermocatellispora tengchongensis]|uniref:Uncharacterized protein n=1 Tax=Thermocatellispora tengchongensis TaxID=1073253 RepID=A0A840P970_9ACTN|nr:hypothetical protein [Thermocatellispora tengchongensis]